MAADVGDKKVCDVFVFFFFFLKTWSHFKVMVESLMLSLSQAFHQKADVRLGHMGSGHLHDATFWLALQLEWRL